jgi:hypothetical protein
LHAVAHARRAPVDNSVKNFRLENRNAKPGKRYFGNGACLTNKVDKNQ